MVVELLAQVHSTEKFEGIGSMGSVVHEIAFKVILGLKLAGLAKAKCPPSPISSQNGYNLMRRRFRC